MPRPTVWIDNDLTTTNIKAAHINNYRDFLTYLENDFCYSHNASIFSSANSGYNNADNITVYSTYRITVYSSKYSPVYSSNCGSVYGTNGN